MKLVLDGAQTMLAKTAADFVTKNEPLTRLRSLRDSKDEIGYSPEVWREIADLGWTGIPFSEDDGGLGMGLSEVVLITEALGRGLVPEPYISAVVMAGRALALGGSAEQKASWLGELIAGDKILSLAYQERGSRYDLNRIGLRAEKGGDGWKLQGEKIQVMDGFGADALIVAARTAGGDDDEDGITLFLVPADRGGQTVIRQWMVDSRNAAMVRFDGVEVSPADVVGTVGEGYSLLVNVVDGATVALCGEMLGGMSEAFDRTLAYLKERQQFGVPIGSFQALKHRAALMFTEIELSRSTVMAAARSFDEGSTDARAQVSNAKARCSDSYILVTNEALQMHGGIGMTDEHDVGFFMKRARVAEMTFGDSAYHRDRFGSLRGF